MGLMAQLNLIQINCSEISLGQYFFKSKKNLEKNLKNPKQNLHNIT